jgi:hypothetical protein
VVKPRGKERLVLEHRAKIPVPCELDLQLLQDEETAASIRVGNERKKDAPHASASNFGDQTVVTDPRS